MPTPNALLIDANALIHRAWHALPPLTSPDGKVVNAAYGFASVLIKILQAEHPEYIAVCWDTPAPTYRHEAEPAYKAQREEQPDEFYEQFDIVKEIVDAFGITNVEKDGYEADDLLATFATRLSKEGVAVTLLTSDRDVWQVIGPHVRVMSFKKGVSETAIIDEKALKEQMGLTPAQIADYKAMRGDASDNLKGVPGIGDKTATELLMKFVDLKGVLKAAKDPKSDMSPAVRKRLIDGTKAAEETLSLVTLVTNVPLKIKDEDLKRRPADEDRIRTLFLRYGFASLLSRIGKSAPKKPAATRPSSPPPVTPQKKSRTGLPAVSGKSISTQQDLNAFLKGISSLIVHPLEVAQESLFAEAPVLALGSEAETILIPPSVLKDAPTSRALAACLQDPKVGKIGHGLKHAWHWCRDHGMDLEGIAFDTEIASYLLAAGEGGHGLPSLAAAELGVTLSDDPIAEVDAIRRLAKMLGEELEAQRLTSVWERFERPLIPVLGKMEAYGILIDRAYFKTLAVEFRRVRAKLEKEMVKLAGESFNPGSPIQLSHILFDVLDLPTKGLKRGKTGISTAASELEKLDGAHPIIEKITAYREIAKLLSTYVETLPELADPEGRVHTTFNQVVAATGRLSSSDPNLQNIPIRTELGRRIRHGFVAPKGYELLSCDYSQVELRVVAALAKDEKMLDAFRKGLDIHTATAAAIWHIPLDEVTKDQRRAAKAINFGIIYGQGPQGLSKAAGIPYAEARQFIDEYFHVYSGIREYLDQTKALAHAQGYVETLFGRRRPIPDINSPLPQFRAAAERMAINMPVQGTATGDLPKLALIVIDRELPKICKEARLLLQVHDEVVLEVPEKDVAKVAKAVKDIMEHVEDIGCPLVVDAKAGKNWEEMTKLV